MWKWKANQMVLGEGEATQRLQCLFKVRKTLSGNGLMINSKSRIWL